MKASVQKIVEQAKMRDTMTRNWVYDVNSGNLGKLLATLQVSSSQVAGTKETFALLHDDDGRIYVLRFNIGQVRPFDVFKTVSGANSCSPEEFYEDAMINALIAARAEMLVKESCKEGKTSKRKESDLDDGKRNS